MATTIKWTDNNSIETAHRIYKSSTYFNKDSLPAVLVELGSDVTEWVDVDGIDGENWYIVSALLNDYEVFSEPFITGFNFTGPGPMTLIGGDPTAGFYGEVPTTDLITGNALAYEIGLTSGISQFSEEPWLKFSIDGKTIFVAKKSYRHTISWNDIDAVNAVHGDSNAPIITINGISYKVRLLTGASENPGTQSNTSGSEWDRLIYRIHEYVPDGSQSYSGEAQQGENWANYSTVDLVGGTSSSYEHVQENYSDDVTRVIHRGFYSSTQVAYFYRSSPTANSSFYKWRPVLELVI